MELHRDTPFEVAFVVTPIAPPRPTLTVVVKATFTLPAEGACAVAPEQLGVTGDVYVDDDPSKPLLHESDLAPIKPRGECLLRARRALSPSAPAGFAVGPVRKVVADARELARCGPVVRTDPARIALAGTFDATWQRDRWPFLPADHDPACHLASPPDQRAPGFWEGDEEVVLRNLLPGHDAVRARLPGLAARAFVLRSPEGEPEALAMRLDTVTVDVDAGCVVALWRGTASVASDRLEDVHALLVWHEPLAARSIARPRPTAAAEGRPRGVVTVESVKKSAVANVDVRASWPARTRPKIAPR